jgi:hypothetical protein
MVKNQGNVNNNSGSSSGSGSVSVSGRIAAIHAANKATELVQKIVSKANIKLPTSMPSIRSLRHLLVLLLGDIRQRWRYL